MSDFLLTPDNIISGLILILGLFLMARGLYEPYTLKNDRQDMDPPGDAAPALNVVFFSDLHANLCRVSDKKLMKAIFSEPCDAVLFGGDACNRGEDIAEGLARLAKIGTHAAELHIPCYAVRGNHDTTIPGEAYLHTGFRVLDNKHVPVAGRSGHKYLLIGIGDSCKHLHNWDSLPTEHFEEYPAERRIVMVHNPEYIYTQQESLYRYQLSGHLHGGQIFMPFGLEYKFLRKEKLPREGIRKGLFIKNGVRGYISRGVGCVLIPLRLFSKPQVTHITFSGQP